jgi:hypothetical protein
MLEEVSALLFQGVGMEGHLAADGEKRHAETVRHLYRHDIAAWLGLLHRYPVNKGHGLAFWRAGTFESWWGWS